MSMLTFRAVFPELAEAETRSATIFEPRGVLGDPEYLPADEYGFVELYCTERGCDCRRVVINVLARYAQCHAATINHAFEKPAADAHVPEQTFLDPLNPQGPYAQGVLKLFVEFLLVDTTFVARLERHYRMFKRVVDDVAHPLHRIVREDGPPQLDPKRIIPPPPRRGKKRRGW